ncbi:MAG: hypothetical protein G8D81_15150 [gamma proteobacterium symbiont of Clathrolucina costata]|uniref:Uncharacterized protein n=1 Tax=Candidatus Thiodiazotropha taylori TaxID=2792791 RepID=A0A9E4NQ92_9GAMM|nr:hypothetical protein [Candidatus Thiodiazotropha taylori]MCW4239158.1 hypothetical protein [Candidatus Thiodiazotropha endolucinida]
MTILSVDAILGLFGGVGLSFSLWWILNHHLVPVIEFSEELSRRPIDFDKQPYRHQFAFKNAGTRSVINVRIKAKLLIVDPRKRGVQITNYFDIKLSSDDIFEMKPGVMLRMSPDIHMSESLDTPLIDSELLMKLKSKEITLDDIFDTYSDAKFYVQIIATDIYSHATKVFQSKLYARSDVRNGVFRGAGLDITPYHSPTQPWAELAN